jgi:molybdopterin-guanine dinucleotide biosynthesis protein B
MTKPRSPQETRAKTPSRDKLPPVLAVVGRSKTGKTTLVERLIHALTEKGYSVGTMKDARGGFEIDLEGKDSDRHYRAGARAVAVLSAEQERMAFFGRLSAQAPIDELCRRLFPDVDLIILEGFKSLGFPKIETTLGEALSCGGDPNLIAVVGQAPGATASVPWFSLADSPALVDLIEDRLSLKTRRPG